MEGIRHARAADAREWLAWYYLIRIVPPQHARKGVRRIPTCARIPFGSILYNAETTPGLLKISQERARTTLMNIRVSKPC
eukprot:5441943-Pyramimonas_sp.AAC.1